jgi:hypothetical protein
VTQDDEEGPLTCVFGCDSPRLEDDPLKRCEDCAFNGLHKCNDSECEAITGHVSGYCLTCRQERDESAREHAAYLVSDR